MNSYHIEQLNWIEKWPPLSIRWHCRFFNWMTSNTRMANAKSGFIYELTKRSAYFMAHETVPNRRYLLLSLSLSPFLCLTPCVFVQSVLFFQRVFWFVGEQQPLLHLAQNDEMPSKMWNDSIFWTWQRNFFFQAIFIFVCLQFQSKMPVLLLSGINSMNTQAEREKKRKRQTRKKR